MGTSNYYCYECGNCRLCCDGVLCTCHSEMTLETARKKGVPTNKDTFIKHEGFKGHCNCTAVNVNVHTGNCVYCGNRVLGVFVPKKEGEYEL